VAPPFSFPARDGRTGRVRLARTRDARACLAISAEAMRTRPRTLAVVEEEFWSAREWRRHVLGWESRGASLVAEIGGVIVGQLGVNRGVRAVTRHSAEFGVVVAAAARGQGAGRALIQAAEQWAREFGVTRMMLGVFTGNEAARGLYADMGYLEEGVETGGMRFPEGLVDVIRMYRFIEPRAEQ
jgi:putative acetyltransferase